jgi:hypothetical protein
MKSRALFAAVLICALCAAAGAQGPAASGYPNVDRPLAIASGDTVQLLNRIVIDRAPGARGPRLDVQYATRIPASNTSAREEQADRLAQIFGAEAAKIGARKVSLGICDTRACAEAREPPRQWYLYERGMGGVWQHTP